MQSVASEPNAQKRGKACAAPSALSPAQQRVAELVGEIYRNTGRPVRTATLALRTNWSERTIRGWLVMLQTRGLILRVGRGMGWLPVRAAEKLPVFMSELRPYRWKHTGVLM